MLPLAPGRFSTSTCWPRRCASGSATTRALLSATPPGENGTMMRTGFCGHSCAVAPFNKMKLSNAARAIRIESRAPLRTAAADRLHRRALLVRGVRRRRPVPPLGSMADRECRRAQHRPRALRPEGARRWGRRRPIAGSRGIRRPRGAENRQGAGERRRLSLDPALQILARPEQQQFRRLGAAPGRHPLRSALEGDRTKVASLTLREARAADARAIAEIHVAAWRAAYRGMMPDAYLASLSV